MSLLLREAPPLLPLMAAVAVCDVAGAQAQIKWPNDVVVAHASVGEPAASDAGGELAKLAGILVEGRPTPGQRSWAVLGIGLNVAVRLEELPAELRREVLTARARTAGCRQRRSGSRPRTSSRRSRGCSTRSSDA